MVEHRGVCNEARWLAQEDELIASSISGMPLRVLVSIVLLLNSMALLAAIGTEQPKTTITPEPAWIKPQTFKPTVLTSQDSPANGTYYMQVERQYDLRDGFNEYVHFAMELYNEAAVEAQSQLQFDFDPDYEELSLHRLGVWREGQFISLLQDTEINLLRRETELEALIYNGTWTATLILQDVRKGDVIEYSYSRNGANPVFDGHVDLSIHTQWSVPIHKQYYRVLWPDGKVLDLRNLNTEERFTTRKHSDFSEYELLLEDAVPLRVDSEAPDWYSPWGRHVFSTTASWEAVATWALQKQQGQLRSSRALQAIADDIRARHVDPAAQLVAALQFVQGEIRYLGIEIGVSGYVPSPPATVLQRRYGDCKDKSFLLLALLKELGIEAYPVLANTYRGKRLHENGPGVYAFNHEIVLARLDGKDYWLDGTRNYQFGNLDTLSQPDYGEVLVLKEDSRDLVRMEVDNSDSRRHYHETFDLRAGIGPEAEVLYTIKTEHHGFYAERFRRRLNEDGLENLQKSYLDYYIKTYPGIEVVEPLSYQDDTERNVVSVEESYRIAQFWQANDKTRRHEASFYSDALYDALESPEQRRRSAPYELVYPLAITQTQTVLLPETWNINLRDETINTPFFEYSDQVLYDEEALSIKLDYRLRTLTDHVSAADIDAYIEAMERVEERFDFMLHSAFEGGNDNSKVMAVEVEDMEPSLIRNLMVLFWLFSLFYLFMEVLLERRHKLKDTAVHYYPVRPLRFFITSMASLNLYLLFWFYKNWAYVKQRDGSSTWPWARALFNAFWLYPLYRSLQNEEQADGLGLQENSAGFALLSIIYLFACLLAGGAFEFIDEAYYIFGMLGQVLMCLPLLQRINELNGGESPHLVHHSRWRVRHAFLLMSGVSLLMLQVGTQLRVLPSDELLEGDELWNSQLMMLREIGVIEKGERLLYYFSDGLLSFEEDGNGMTEQQVFSYWRDYKQAQLYVEKARFSEIENISLDRDTGLGHSSLKVTRVDGSSFTLYLPHEGDADNKFVEQLRRNLQQ